MPFPESTRVVFEENTLVDVICQLRFPTILAVAAELPARFQEAIRAQYPIYRREEGIQNLPTDIATMLAELKVPAFSETVTHRFDSEDASRQVSLTADFVAVTEHQYTHWARFKQEVERAESALADVYAPAFYSRIGLRYQDVVRRNDLGMGDIPWSELLNPTLLSLLGSEQAISTSVEAMRTDSLLRLPDVEDGFVKLTHGLVEDTDGDVYAIDMDFFTTRRADRQDVFAILDNFNRKAGNLFRWSITPRLRDALRPTSLDQG